MSRTCSRTHRGHNHRTTALSRSATQVKAAVGSAATSRVVPQWVHITLSGEVTVCVQNGLSGRRA